MPQYLIESPHTKEECMQALDQISEQQPQLLNQSWFGCTAGEHIEWAAVEANSKEDARNMLPDFLRSKAHIVEVNKLSPEQIKSFHQM